MPRYTSKCVLEVFLTDGEKNPKVLDALRKLEKRHADLGINVYPKGRGVANAITVACPNCISPETWEDIKREAMAIIDTTVSKRDQ